MCATDKITEEVPTFCPDAARGLNKKGHQLYHLKKKHELERAQPRAVRPQRPDWLATSTQIGRDALEHARTIAKRFQGSKTIKFIPRIKSLPLFLIAISLSIIIATLAVKLNNENRTDKSKLWTVLYLGSFAMHFGAQIWMTMISGVVLYFTLPRHVFGNVQEKLFPAFYTFASVSSFVMIISYMNTQSDIAIGSANFVQVLCMTLAFTIEMFVRLYVAGPIVMLKHVKTQMESSIGTGQEVGRHILGELVNCPHYMKILRRFRRLHSYTAIATIATIGCSAYHINYLAERICI